MTEYEKPRILGERVCVVDDSMRAITVKEPIVRCRDCKHMFDWAYDRMLCKMWADADIDEPEGNVLYPCVKPDGFCAWGEMADA